MVALLHVAGLAGRGRGGLGQDAGLLQECRTPCFEAEYISHCGWSKPMWQVWQAWGWRASFTEKRCRVWQASQEATPKPPPSS